MQREFALKEQIASLQFSSESAKKAFLSDLSAKELPLQEGKLLGFDDFVKTYQQSDPAAFAAQQSTPPPPVFLPVQRVLHLMLALKETKQTRL